MKKATILILCAALFASVITGCGSKPKDTDQNGSSNTAAHPGTGLWTDRIPAAKRILTPILIPAAKRLF